MSINDKITEYYEGGEFSTTRIGNWMQKQYDDATDEIADDKGFIKPCLKAFLLGGLDGWILVSTVTMTVLAGAGVVEGVKSLFTKNR